MNRQKLWNALINGVIDYVISDHSPCTADLKDTGGDFMTAWGGIASVQFGLPALWTECRKKGIKPYHIRKWLCENPAKRIKLHNQKGKISVGFDADFVIWDPDCEFEVQKDQILFKNKMSPYIGKKFFGKVVRTILRGRSVFDTTETSGQGGLVGDQGPFGKFV